MMSRISCLVPTLRVGTHCSAAPRLCGKRSIRAQTDAERPSRPLRRGSVATRFLLHIAFPLCVMLAVVLADHPAAAQPIRGAAAMAGAGMGGGRTVPTASYHAAFADFYDGDYRTALNRFQSEARGAIKTVNARWIDSICYETMIGECYYQMGANNDAFEHYTAALNLFLANPTWFSNVVPQPIRAASPQARPPWQVRNLLAPLGHLNPTMSIQMGQLQLAAQGQAPPSGVVMPAQLFPVEPYEIIRCTCLALRRRAELLGPLAAHDTLFDNAIAALQRPAGHPNHWSEAWINVELARPWPPAGATPPPRRPCRRPRSLPESLNTS